MPNVRRIAVSSRVSAAKRASELDATTNIQRNRASAVVISSARPGARCDSSSEVPTSCNGMTPTCAPPRVGLISCVRRFQHRRRLVRLLGQRGGGLGWRRRRPQRHAAARRPADFRQQLLGLGRRRGIQQIGQHRAAAVVGLDRHAALAARRVRPHQRPPGAFMRAVDLQQTLRRRDRRLRLDLLAQQRLGDGAGAVTQPFALGGQPGVEGGIDAVQILQQIAVQQGQRGRLVGGRPHHLFDVDPDHAGPQRQVVAGDRPGPRSRPAPAIPAADGSPGAARRGPALRAGGSRAVRPGGRATRDAAMTVQ